jgi:chorismate dehydratase
VVATTPYPSFDLHTYYTHFINYQLDPPKRAALQLFLAKLTGELQPAQPGLYIVK